LLKDKAALDSASNIALLGRNCISVPDNIWTSVLASLKKFGKKAQ
jgi:hypothetical protein